MPFPVEYAAIFMLDDGDPAHHLLPWRLPAFQEALRCRRTDLPWVLQVPPEGLYPASDKDLAPGLTREDADQIKVAHQRLCKLKTHGAKVGFMTNIIKNRRPRVDNFKGREIYIKWFKMLWDASQINKVIDVMIAEAHCLPHHLQVQTGMDNASPRALVVYNQIARYIFGAEAFLSGHDDAEAVLDPHYYTAVSSIVHKARKRWRIRNSKARPVKDVTLVKKATSKVDKCLSIGEDEQPVVAVEDGVKAKVQSQGASLKRLTAPGGDQVPGKRKRFNGDGAWYGNIQVLVDTPTRTLRPRPQKRSETHPSSHRSRVKVPSKSPPCIVSDKSDDDRASAPLLSVVNWAALSEEMRSSPESDDSMDLSTMEEEGEWRSEDENEVEAAGEDTPMPASAELVSKAGRGRGWLQTVLSSSGDNRAGGEAGATRTLPCEMGSEGSSDGDGGGPNRLSCASKGRTSDILQGVTLVPGRKLFLNSKTEELRQRKWLDLLEGVGFTLAKDSEIQQAFEVWAEAHRHFPITWAKRTREWPFPPFPTVSMWFRHKWPGINQSDYNRLMLTVLDREKGEENDGGFTNGRRGE